MIKSKKILFFLLASSIFQVAVYCQYKKEPPIHRNVYTQPLSSTNHRREAAEALSAKQRENVTSRLRNSETSKPIVYFSPEDLIAKKLIALIKKAKHSIYISVYMLTDLNIMLALGIAKLKGRDVQIIVDSSCFKRHCHGIEWLKKSILRPSVFVWLGKGLMHNKFVLFDNCKVWTGSYNFTVTANRENKENAIIIENKDLYNEYKKEFDIIKSKSFVLNIYCEINKALKKAYLYGSLSLRGLGITNQQLENILLYLTHENINRSLTLLDLEDNNIDSLQDCEYIFQSFTQLTTLDLSHNQLMIIPDYLKRPNSLDYLNLKDNPIEWQPGQLEIFREKYWLFSY